MKYQNDTFLDNERVLCYLGEMVKFPPTEGANMVHRTSKLRKAHGSDLARRSQSLLPSNSTVMTLTTCSNGMVMQKEPYVSS